MHVDECKLVDLPKIKDHRGNLTFMEGGRHLPFDIKRAFFIYDIPSGEDRGAHAHYDLHQFVICLAGGLTVYLDDGNNQRTVVLNRPWVGLHIPPMIWAAEGAFNPGTVYLVFASDYYKAESYIRDYNVFLDLVKKRD